VLDRSRASHAAEPQDSRDPQDPRLVPASQTCRASRAGQGSLHRDTHTPGVPGSPCLGNVLPSEGSVQGDVCAPPLAALMVHTVHCPPPWGAGSATTQTDVHCWGGGWLAGAGMPGVAAPPAAQPAADKLAAGSHARRGAAPGRAPGQTKRRGPAAAAAAAARSSLPLPSSCPPPPA